MRTIDVLLLDAQISGGLPGFNLTWHVGENFPDIEILLTFGASKAAESR